jgi:hypothetical protein
MEGDLFGGLERYSTGVARILPLKIPGGFDARVRWLMLGHGLEQAWRFFARPLMPIVRDRQIANWVSVARWSAFVHFRQALRNR